MVPQRRPRRLPALPLALFGLAACASGGAAPSPGPSLLPSGWTPPPGQRCEVQREPRQLPSAAQLVDSAALVGELAPAPGGGHALFTIAYDSLGVADSVEHAGGDLPLELREGWRGAVEDRLRERSPIPAPVAQGRPRGWSVLLRVDAGNPPALRVGRSEECPPALTNSFAVTSYVQQAFADFVRANPVHRRPATVMVRMWVDHTGAVQSAEVTRSSAITQIQEIARHAALRAQFQPAMVNRTPVGVWVTLPIQFVVPAETTRRSRS